MKTEFFASLFCTSEQTTEQTGDRSSSFPSKDFHDAEGHRQDEQQGEHHLMEMGGRGAPSLELGHSEQTEKPADSHDEAVPHCFEDEEMDEELHYLVVRFQTHGAGMFFRFGRQSYEKSGKRAKKNGRK